MPSAGDVELTESMWLKRTCAVEKRRIQHNAGTQEKVAWLVYDSGGTLEQISPIIKPGLFETDVPGSIKVHYYKFA